MLGFSVRPGEKICIGENIIIEVTEIDRGKVKIGISAPKSIPILRDEIIERINAGEVRRGKAGGE